MTDTKMTGEQLIAKWVTLCGEVLAQGIPPANIKWALDKWGQTAQELYPLAEEGEPVSLDTDSLDGALDALAAHPELQREFLGTTLLCLFEGADGPVATGKVLEDAVDTLEASIREQEKANAQDD